MTSGSDNMLGGKIKPHWLVSRGTDPEGGCPRAVGNVVSEEVTLLQRPAGKVGGAMLPGEEPSRRGNSLGGVAEVEQAWPDSFLQPSSTLLKPSQPKWPNPSGTSQPSSDKSRTTSKQHPANPGHLPAARIFFDRCGPCPQGAYSPQGHRQ